MSERLPTFEMQEATKNPEFNVADVSLSGFGFGGGAISPEKISPEARVVTSETILTNPLILVEVSRDKNGKLIDDDGCGDGRKVVLIYTKDEQFDQSLNRAKVFGGGATMAMAIIIGTGNAHDAPLKEVFQAGIEELGIAGLNYGAHTDEHAHGPNCGCGAIDKAPEALFAAARYEKPIREVLASLNLGIDNAVIDSIYSNFRAYIHDSTDKFDGYAGKDVMDDIIADAKVVKQLGDTHKECGIVLNFIQDHTVNQGLVREVTNDEAQIFAVDVWRMQAIAEQIVGTDDLSQEALLSELIYTLAIAAVLTDGKLPVYAIQPDTVPQAA